MRPAYQTRCYNCGERLTISDEWRVKTIDKKKVQTFHVDDIISSEHQCKSDIL